MNEALQAMYNLLKRDRRFKFEAYLFVREALAYAQENDLFAEPGQQPGSTNPAATDPTTREAAAVGQRIAAASGDAAGLAASRHVTGQQLCEACRLYGLEQYGFLATRVLSSWGVHSTSDFGEIVYNLIDIEQMRKSESDRREDFDDIYSFDTAFVPQFARQTSHPHG